jgi:hypothetical protein
MAVGADQIGVSPGASDGRRSGLGIEGAGAEDLAAGGERRRAGDHRHEHGHDQATGGHKAEALHIRLI